MFPKSKVSPDWRWSWKIIRVGTKRRKLHECSSFMFLQFLFLKVKAMRGILECWIKQAHKIELFKQRQCSGIFLNLTQTLLNKKLILTFELFSKHYLCILHENFLRFSSFAWLPSRTQLTRSPIRNCQKSSGFNPEK